MKNLSNVYFKVECGKYSHWGYITHGEENGIREMAETMRHAQNKPVLVTFVYNTHKNRVLQAKNGNTAITANFSDAQRLKAFLGNKLRILKVVK